MRVLTLLFIICTNHFALSASISHAQTYPAYTSTTVNDFANLLGGPLEERLSERLERLKRETGVEMTIVTLESKSTYAPGQSLEQFAMGLFNDWGVGDAQRNDGVMLLVLSEDRELRIELGEAYGADWNYAAERVVDDTMVPWLRDDEYATGIDLGMTDVIATIIEPYLEGADAPQSEPEVHISDRIFMIVAFIVAAIGLFSGQIRQWLISRQKCPQCRQRKLVTVTRVVRSASFGLSGEGIRSVNCSNCDYRNESRYIIPSHRQSSGGSGGGGGFGGGRSGGGGASGRF